MAIENSFLEHKAYQLRRLSLLATTQAGSGHPTSCLSAADIVAALFFYAMRYDPCHPEYPTNDRFILSKGHAAPLLYAALVEAGAISEQELLTLRQFDSVFEGHPTPRCPFVEAATGSLGQGLSIAIGYALAAQLEKSDAYTYVLLGDSEIAEGQIWEAAELAAHYKLDSVIAILDCNGLGQSTPTLDGHNCAAIEAKFSAFGWQVIVIDGHVMPALVQALDQARTVKEKPVMIIAKTIKGYGLVSVENKEGFHGKAFSREQLPELLVELQKRFAHVAKKVKQIVPELHRPLACTSTVGKVSAKQIAVKISVPSYTKGQMIAPRKAYGYALQALGAASPDIVVLDAEVKNSTYAELFEAKYPERFFQCFIAEQNMVGMAVGFARRGKIPFASTFSAFLSRAVDQVRMAALSQAAVRLVGSHAGVSIGQDGPSQMGLEDVAYMRAIPNSIVLSACDAVSAYKLVELMARYSDGISYLRTIRAETSVVYANEEEFVIGGSKVLRQSDHDQACIMATGITVFEALKAYEILLAAGITCRVIDCYSIKPLDEKTLACHAQQAGKKVVTVEDHYRAGGFGEALSYALRNENIALTSLAVDKIPRSGKPEELMRYEAIDAQAIVAAVKA